MPETTDQTNEARPQRLRPYSAYKESGVEWLGAIPTTWEVQPLKYVATFSTGWTPPTGREDLYGGEHLWANISDLGPKILKTTEKTITDAAIKEARLSKINVGTLLFSFKLSIGAVSIAGVNMYTNEAIAAFTPSSRIDTGFLFWAAPVLIPRNAQDNIYGAPLLSQERIANAKFLIPALNEQHAIAAFLERETAKIDASVEQKERLIELLQEKRTALITRAVTRGLDRNAPLKDSGVEWLGEIPAHWNVSRLKHLTPGTTVGIVVTPSKYYVDEGVPCLRSLNVSGGEINEENLVFISESANELHQKSRIFAGDVVVVRTGQAGTAAVVPKTLHGANCIDLLIVRRSKQLLSQFVYYYLNSRAAMSQATGLSVGAIQAHYNTSTLAQLVIPKVPIDEQSRIMSYLDSATEEIDQLITKVLEATDRLREFRNTLISAAVTGKIDVRDATT